MTLSSTQNRVSYNCDGSTKTFSFPYTYYNKSHIVVVLVAVATGAEEILELDTDYSLTEAPAPDGGTLTTLAANAYSSDYKLLIYRDVPAKQETDLISGGALPAESVEQTFDLAVMMVQQILEQFERIPTLPVGSDLTKIVLPVPGAGKIIRWNEAGNQLEAADINDIDDNVVQSASSASVAATAATDAYASATAAAASAATAAADAADADASATAAAASAAAAVVDAADADASATAAAASAAAAVDLIGLMTGEFKNLIINGNPLINQRVYVSGTATSGANKYTLDRWRVVVSGQSVSWSDSGNIRTVTAPAGGMEQVIEGANIVSGMYTLSWNGTATATVDGNAVSNGGQVTLTGGTDAVVRMTDGTWSKLQLEPVAVATLFEQRPIGVELALCQRYYCKSYAIDVAPGTQTFNGSISISAKADTYQANQIRFPVPMRTTPTLTLYSTETGTPGYIYNYSTVNDVESEANHLNSSGFGIVDLIVYTPTTEDLLIYHYKADAEL